MKYIILGLFAMGCVQTTEPIKPSFNQSLFPEKAWAEKVWELTADMPKVSDEKEFCPQGLTHQNWVHLFASIAKNESNFRPTLEFREGFKNGRGEWVISTGLFQVSYESSRGYGFPGITTQDLKDPIKNIEVAVAIIKRLAGQDGRLAGKRPNGTWAGGARYFSVLRNNKVKDTVKPLCE